VKHYMLQILQMHQGKWYNATYLKQSERKMWINGFENRYEITIDGRVFFHSRDGNITERKLVPDKNGYMTVNLKIGSKVYCKKIHREVGIAFVSPFNGEQINHINGIKSDNRAENLEWCTVQHNINHMLDNGLKTLGEKYKNNKSGFYGVYLRNGIYYAQVKRNNIINSLGSFNDISMACNAVNDFIKSDATYESDYSEAKL